MKYFNYVSYVVKTFYLINQQWSNKNAQYKELHNQIRDGFLIQLFSLV